ncbi:Putative retroelement polyprotein [Trichosporon asahii var. asahii CBS 2479]|uniref:Putative retroelement polyprotein n=1 Tax=Trichosporon asahii var. asahii (strain ATCC 90039 / CBS 2479 / JCM 2466 / KCTC 7840 / NBRC 103889/ NCYC 2677 / UAMH 7654) TaxID=1186058 RepID=J6F7E7_TRIAS|nr:Putative retroelement polyprotein [Trichosporon asahii var. asahii CBS 2479]EJT51277.1 Putative retroelement polyprotein [Trichosporon asahii var. asahii CBS 2479]
MADANVLLALFLVGDPSANTLTTKGDAYDLIGNEGVQSAGYADDESADALGPPANDNTATATALGWAAPHLNGPLSEEIYVSPQPGVQTASGNCLRLHKALYGLKQSGRAWWLELGRVLHKYGFKRCSGEWGLYSKWTKQGPIILLTYVDDILICCPKKDQADHAPDALNEDRPRSQE